MNALISSEHAHAVANFVLSGPLGELRDIHRDPRALACSQQVPHIGRAGVVLTDECDD